MPSFYGLDFGTTNSSLSILREGESKLLPIDIEAPDRGVVRSALYFFPRQLMVSNKVNKEQITTQTFMHDQIWYEGEEKTLIGNGAVRTYLTDNRSRHQGVRRKIYTGKIIKNVILYVTPGGSQVLGDIPDYYEEIDFGTGRLFHALKTALKSPYYKGVTVFGKYYSLEEMIGLFVSKMKSEADRIMGEKIESVVVGRPVMFSPDPEKDKAAQERLEQAIRNAGFKNISFEFEPVAAAKYYLSRFPSGHKKILVFDFGGGTFDTTVTDNEKGNKVLATDGVYIGGDLLNSDIFYYKLGKYFGIEITWGEKQMPMPSHIVSALKSWFGIPNLNNPNDIEFLTGKAKYKCSDPQAVERLLHLIQKNLGFEIYEAIEVAKKALTYKDKTTIDFKDEIINISMEITKEEFEKLITPRVNEVRDCVMRTLRNAKLSPEDIDVVVRTGGSSLIPIFEKMLVDTFGKEKVTEFDPFTSVAAGLALG